ncbi:MAG: methyltransferase domain-containing protein [bacterium]|nr:methyltransferase domain-containing protein [bacterium]
MASADTTAPPKFNAVSFIKVFFDLPAQLEEELPELMDGLETLGCHVEPNLSDAWANVYFQADRSDEAERFLRRLEARRIVGTRIDGIEPRDWMGAFRSGVRPFAVGDRWWIDPHPDTPTDAPAGRHRLAIEPRMAFGSGTHESTQLILELMESIPFAERSVLDVGTGSGILSLAALHLGACRAVAFDIDADAIWVARQTARLNIARETVEFFAGPIEALSGCRFDVVLCNMVPMSFLPLLSQIRCRLNEQAIAVVSGVLCDQGPWVVKALSENEFDIIEERRKGEWTALVATRRFHEVEELQ